jgi:hypothetical protein
MELLDPFQIALYQLARTGHCLCLFCELNF